VTTIEWTDETWNPTTGCDRVSPGCDNCYALAMAGRLKAMGSPKYQRDGDPAETVTFTRANVLYVTTSESRQR